MHKPHACQPSATLNVRALLMRCVASLLLAQLMSGCSSDDSAAPAAAAGPSSGSTQPPTGQRLDGHGRFIGTVAIGNVAYFGDAVLTVDGKIRLYIGDPYEPDGVLQAARPRASAQVIGAVDQRGVGDGIVAGQTCSATTSDWFCSEAATAQIELTGTQSGVAGRITVSTRGGADAWTLSLARWENYYVLPARVSDVAGLYQELLAAFAVGDDTMTRIDQDGRMFFQSARSGCTGNGALTPHLDGRFAVYDVRLSIGGCDAAHAFMNGDFEGLASESASSYWNYDSMLRIWLSRGAGADSEAITMLGSR
jgi:hypothetical protein